MKKVVVFLILSLCFILSACNSVKSNLTILKSGKEIDDIHGVGVSKNGNTYIVTNEGLILTSNQGRNWYKVGETNNELIGFHLRSDGTFITSGHPGLNSKLPSSLGVQMSNDKGLNWKALGYAGKITFHILTSDYSDPKVIYCLNKIGNEKYSEGIYKSNDNGKTWIAFY